MGPVDKILSRFARHARQRDRQLEYSDDSSVPSILTAIDVQNSARYKALCPDTRSIRADRRRPRRA